MKHNITQEDIIQHFELDEKCTVDQENIDRFVNLITGAFLLHREVYNTKKILKTVFKNGKKAKLRLRLEGHGRPKCYREHLRGHSNSNNFEVGYRQKGDLYWHAFFSLTEEEARGDIQVAHSLWQAQLHKIISKYSKYGVTADVDMHYFKKTMWYIQFENMRFLHGILYRDPDGIPKIIGPKSVAAFMLSRTTLTSGYEPKIAEKILAPIRSDILSKAIEKSRKKRLKNERQT